MKFANLFFYFFVCWLSKSTFAAIVSDLKPDVNCDAVLASGTADRAKDPSIVSVFESSQFDIIYRSSEERQRSPNMEPAVKRVQKIICVTA